MKLTRKISKARARRTQTAPDAAIATILKRQLDGDHDHTRTAWGHMHARYPKEPRIPFFASLFAYTQRETELAVRLMRHCLTMCPDNADAHYNLGKFLEEQQQPAEAMESYIESLVHEPEHVQALNNLGNLYLGGGDYETAQLCYDKALAIQTTNDDALYNRSFLKLLKGDLAGGFADYEHRWKCHGFLAEYRRDWMKEKPMWDATPLEGRSLLVVAEQGFGDTIQMWRYIQPLHEQVGAFTVAVQPALFDLLRRNAPSEVTVMRNSDPCPAFDLWTPMMSLPHLAGGRIPTWQGPYLRVAREAAA